MNDLKQTVGFLQKVPLFQGLNNRQLEHLAKRMVERTYISEQPIVTQGKGGEGFFVIVSGKAEAFRERGDGVRVEVNTFGPTDFFGELALLDDGLRTGSTGVDRRADGAFGLAHQADVKGGHAGQR